MKKRGFTLAEVLITLGIIGVIAALTAPALVMNSRNEANAAKLAVTMSNIENALTNAIATEGVEDLFGTRMWPAATLNGSSGSAAVAPFVGNLGRYLHVNGYKATGNSTAHSDFYGANKGPFSMTTTGGVGAQNNSGMDNTFRVDLKNGAALFFRVFTGNEQGFVVRDPDVVANLGGALYKQSMDLYIDVNGKVGPNTWGRDVFTFYVGNNGILYPVGGIDTSIYDYANANSGLWSNANASGSHSCADGAIALGKGCTARLIAEGYKMNY